MPRLNSLTTIAITTGVFALAGIAWLLKSNQENQVQVQVRAQEQVPSGSTQSSREKKPHRDLTSTRISESKWNALTRDDLPRHQRLELARQISDRLSPEDTATLYAALKHTPPSANPEEWYVILNEIMEQMRRHGLGADEYSSRLGEIIADTQQPEVVRDYAIQHLSGWIAPADPAQAPHETDDDAIRQSLAHVTGAIADPAASQTSIPGTGLLMLANVSARLPAEFTAPAWLSLEPFLTSILSGDGAVSPSTRISAVQAVGLAGQSQFLPAVRLLAADDAAEPSVRLSSIASLGLYAAPEDRAFLQEISTGDSRYKFAAQTALQRLGQD